MTDFDQRWRFAAVGLLPFDGNIAELPVPVVPVNHMVGTINRLREFEITHAIIAIVVGLGNVACLQGGKHMRHQCRLVLCQAMAVTVQPAGINE